MSKNERRLERLKKKARSVRAPGAQAANPKDSLATLKSILAPVMHEIVGLRLETDGIVFVVRRPSEEMIEFLKAHGVPDPDPKGTSVFALSCEEATSLKFDLLTRRWCAIPPKEDEFKVFLISGGTALLTLTNSKDGVIVKKEPDIFPVE